MRRQINFYRRGWSTVQSQRRRPKGGFTLLELLIVIVLFSVGAVVLLEIFSIGLVGGVENENALVATALAQERIESIRNSPYASVVGEAKAPVAGYEFFQREVSVALAQPSLKQVTVNVYWTQRSGETKLSLVTYVSEI